MSTFVNIHRQVRHIETYPEEPFRCANCRRRREDYEKGWQLRHTSYEVDDADEAGAHIIVRHRDHYYVCPTCAAMDPRKPTWRRLLRSLAPDEDPPKSYASPYEELDESVRIETPEST